MVSAVGVEVSASARSRYIGGRLDIELSLPAPLPSSIFQRLLWKSRRLDHLSRSAWVAQPLKYRRRAHLPWFVDASKPQARVWTFSLDGHDFYVLRLGDSETLVYDLYSEQWVDWANFQKEFWRANNGQNWAGASKLAYTYGSDVVVGDDTYGLLWFLDPEQPYDQDPDYLAPVQEQYLSAPQWGR